MGYQQIWSFGHPIPGVPRAIVFACQDDEGNAVSLIALRCLKDVQLNRHTGRGHDISWTNRTKITSQLSNLLENTQYVYMQTSANLSWIGT